MVTTRTQLVVMVYDIANDQRRTKLHALLKEYGEPIQESAFEARLTIAERKHLLRRVGQLVDSVADRFVIYPIAREQEAGIVAVGIPRTEVKARSYYIV
jgi:CRISPR-associated protein Cas2